MLNWQDDEKSMAVREGFARTFGTGPTLLARAPGRLEILGNHTDYNGGTVLSTAVDRYMRIAAAPAAGPLCRLVDLNDRSERVFSLDDLGHPIPGDWANYIKGMVVEMKNRGVSVPPFQAALCSDVPLSAGMSSSAALEMAMVLILRELSGAKLSPLDCARIGQAAENNYVGAKTGLLDQFSSLHGQADFLIYSDFRNLTVSNVPIPAGTAFVVANSMVRHTLTGEYNERRQACEEAARILADRWPAVTTLRDVTPDMLLQARASLPPVTFRRALHVVSEIDRVERGCQALAGGDVATFGRLMSESHQSSIDNFENSCAELDLLVQLGQSLPGCLGARLSGGGFGGITVHLVQARQAAEYQTRLAELYRQHSGRECAVISCRSADGAACRHL